MIQHARQPSISAPDLLGSDSRTPSPAPDADFPFVKKIRNTTSSLVAGGGPTLRVSDEANKILGVLVDFDQEWKFPGAQRNSHTDWPLPAEGVLMSAIVDEETSSSSNESATLERIDSSRRDTLARLEGMTLNTRSP
jgi:hypothetical protein